MRQMATIRRIAAIQKHDNADALELAIIDGWQCVVKKGEFTAGDAVVYCEIDSFIPHEVAPFLTKEGHEPKEYEGIKGQRLRTIRLRGEVSQGLVLPLSVIPVEKLSGTDPLAGLEVGMDVTDVLGVKKWERAMSANMRGNARRFFPNFIQKTDQERVQNMLRTLEKRQRDNPDEEFEVTLKLDGSSTTFYVYSEAGEVGTGVCSRNLELKTDESNAENIFVQKFHELELDRKLRVFQERYSRNIAVQGELWGKGINGNWEGIDDIRFHVFDVFDCDKYRYVDADTRYDVVDFLNLPHVPVLGIATLAQWGVGSLKIEDFLKFADRESVYNPIAEGVVFKSLTDPQFSFKCINTKYLLEGGD